MVDQRGLAGLFFRSSRTDEMIFMLAVVAASSVLARLRSRHTWRQQDPALPHTLTGLLEKMWSRVARTPERGQISCYDSREGGREGEREGRPYLVPKLRSGLIRRSGL